MQALVAACQSPPAEIMQLRNQIYPSARKTLACICICIRTVLFYEKTWSWLLTLTFSAKNLLLCSIEALWTVRVSCLLLFFSSLRDTQMKKKREKHWYWKRAACVRWPKEGMQWLSCYLAICLWRSDKKSTGSHCALKNGACRSASSMSAKRRLSMSSILACWSNLMQSRATIPQLAKCTGMFEAKLVKMLEHWNQKKTHLSSGVLTHR